MIFNDEPVVYGQTWESNGTVWLASELPIF